MTAWAMMFLLAGVSRLAGATSLEQTLENWLGERDHWAFTQRAVEYEKGRPQERVERYDPSLPGNRRWALLSVDGRPPTDQQRAAWEKRKFKKNRRRFDSPIGDFFAFDRARLVSETDKQARYNVPLRSDKSWLFPTDKVEVMVTINKESRALDHLTAQVREPFKVLLGLARITGGQIDLDFDEMPSAEPANARPNGTASVSMSRFGERVDFTWSDFKRVNPHRDRQVEKGTAALEP